MSTPRNTFRTPPQLQKQPDRAQKGVKLPPKSKNSKCQIRKDLTKKLLVIIKSQITFPDFKLQFQTSPSNFSFKLQLQTSTSNFNFKLQLQTSPSHNLKVQLQLQTSNFKTKLQTSTSIQNFNFNFNFNLKLQLQLQTSNPNFDFILQT